MSLSKGERVPMNKLRSFFVTGTALVMSLGTAAVAQAQYYAPPPPGYYHHHHHHWHVGDRYYGPRHIIVHWRHFRLPPPPYAMCIFLPPSEVIFGFIGETRLV